MDKLKTNLFGKELEVDFIDRLFILTGPNNSGKTTVLNQLSTEEFRDSDINYVKDVNISSVDYLISLLSVEAFLILKDTLKKEFSIKIEFLTERQYLINNKNFKNCTKAEIRVIEILTKTLVMLQSPYYRLGNVVLIDTPESYLHIVWQHKIMEVLLELTETYKKYEAESSLKFIIATHSPTIIGSMSESMFCLYSKGYLNT